MAGRVEAITSQVWSLPRVSKRTPRPVLAPSPSSPVQKATCETSTTTVQVRKMVDKLSMPTLPNSRDFPSGAFSINCDNSFELIPNECSSCGICNEGDFDLCQKCVDQGTTGERENHRLFKRTVKGVEVSPDFYAILPPRNSQNKKATFEKVEEAEPASIQLAAANMSTGEFSKGKNPTTLMYDPEKVRFFIHYTISEDRTGNTDSVLKQRLAFLGNGSRKRKFDSKDTKEDEKTSKTNFQISSPRKSGVQVASYEEQEQRPISPSTGTEIIVLGLPEYPECGEPFTEDDVRGIFQGFGAISRVKVLHWIGCAEVSFFFRHEAEIAFTQMQGFIFRNSKLSLSCGRTPL